MTIDYSHLDALELSLSHERERLRLAQHPLEIEYRSIWVRQYEREIAQERAFLGLPEADSVYTLDDIFAEMDAKLTI